MSKIYVFNSSEPTRKNQSFEVVEIFCFREENVQQDNVQQTLKVLDITSCQENETTTYLDK